MNEFDTSSAPEPTATILSMDSLATLTPDASARLRDAVATLPPNHLKPPEKGESFKTRGEAVLRVQNWAFTEEFAIITLSSTATRVVYGCIHHDKETRNRRLVKVGC